jgi:hypothetical protein
MLQVCSSGTGSVGEPCRREHSDLSNTVQDQFPANTAFTRAARCCTGCLARVWGISLKPGPGGSRIAGCLLVRLRKLHPFIPRPVPFSSCHQLATPSRHRVSLRSPARCPVSIPEHPPTTPQLTSDGHASPATMCIVFTCGEHTFRKEVEGYEGLVCRCYNCGNYSGSVVKSHPWFTFCFIVSCDPMFVACRSTTPVGTCTDITCLRAALTR